MSTATGFAITLSGAPLPAGALGLLNRVECEEHLHLADILRLEFTPSPKPGAAGWEVIDDGLFPRLAEISLAVTVGTATTLLFSGHVLETRAVFASDPEKTTFTVTAFDASILMHLESKTRAWPDMADSDIAEAVFAEYGFATSIQGTTPTPSADHTLLIQAETDMELLLRLARRNGYDCRVSPGTPATGHFHAPDYAATPQGVLSVGLGAQSNIETLTLTRDMLRPATATVRNTDAGSLEALSGSATGITHQLLGTDGVLGTDRPRTLAPGPAGADDPGALQQLAEAAVNASALAIRAEGTVATGGYGALIRAGTPILLRGAGTENSGRFMVERVLHVIAGPAYTQSFTLVRNATGAQGEDYG